MLKPYTTRAARVNVGGGEVSLSLEVIENLHANVSYTYLDASNPDGSEEVRRPPHSASFSVNYGFLDGRGNVFVDAIYNGEMKDSDYSTWPATPVSLSDYTVVNVGADYQLNDNLQVFGRVENAFDKGYEEVYGYNTQGRTFFAGLQATF